LAYFSQNPCIQQENSSNISFICIGLRFFQEALIINKKMQIVDDALARFHLSDIQPGRSLWLLLGHASGMPHFIYIIRFNASAFQLLLFDLAFVKAKVPGLAEDIRDAGNDNSFSNQGRGNCKRRPGCFCLIPEYFYDLGNFIICQLCRIGCNTFKTGRSCASERICLPQTESSRCHIEKLEDSLLWNIFFCPFYQINKCLADMRCFHLL
jgi:hypothetical protein